MKKKKTLIICMLLGIMLLTSCGKTDHQDQASVATEQTSGDSRPNDRRTCGNRRRIGRVNGSSRDSQAAVEAVESTESSEYAERKSIIITATNECGIDIGMFSGDRSDQRRTIQYQCNRRWTVCFHAGRVAGGDHRFSVGAL